MQAFKRVAEAVESILEEKEDCHGWIVHEVGFPPITVTASFYPALVTLDEDKCSNYEPVETLEDLILWLRVAKKELRRKGKELEEEFRKIKEAICGSL